MNSTVNHPEGHRLRPWFSEALGEATAHMYCRNCLLIDPEPGTECEPDDDEQA